MRTSNDCLSDKKIDYKCLAIASIYGTSGKDMIHIPISTLKENKDDIERISRMKFQNVMKSLNKSVRQNGELIENTRLRSNKRILTIFCKDKHNKGYAVVEDDILKSLAENCDSNTIKIYLLLKNCCYGGERTITREFICNSIGLSTCSPNMTKISKITDNLVKMGLINKKVTRDGVCKHISYSLKTYEEWKEFNEVK